MGATYHATAIVLRREPWRDSGRIYTLYTREWGKILAVGRGTAKTLSKLGPHLEPFSLVEVHIAHGRRLETLAGAVLRRAPDALVESESRHAAAAFFAEAADHFVKWSERDERLWSLFDGFLAEVALVDDADVPTLLSSFVWRFMDCLGYRPALDSCVSCRVDVTFGGGLFLPTKGTILCANCRPEERHLTAAMPVRPDQLTAIANHLTPQPVPLGTGTQGSGTLEPGLAFLEAHLDRPLNSLPIIRNLLLADRKVPDMV